MVWFQCEDCGENLKKPKLPNHFRFCSANKLSCIDCGETFGQHSVQSHTQCISEAEKYGPKGFSKGLNGSAPKTKNDSKQKADVDINVGLSERAPWFCSLCNTQATSRQALLIHAEGKKHRGKARAFHAANQPAEQKEKPTSDVPSQKTTDILNEQDASDSTAKPAVSEGENTSSLSTKKRKLDTSEDAVDRKKSSGEPANGEVIQADKEKATNEKVKDDGTKENLTESNSTKGNRKEKINWKNLISKSLKSSQEGVLKMKELRKLVLEAIRESGITEDEKQLKDVFKQKLSSSSKFVVDGKYVRLAAKN